MKESKKVFIKGVPGRGAEVIKALEDRGGVNSSYWKGDSDNSVYFIDHLGKICRIGHDCELLNVIADNYRELKLPEKWKDGDILVNIKFDECFAVCKSDCNIWDSACHCYMFADFERNIINTKDGYIVRSSYRLATPSEVERFHELLHKHGKDWDAEKKQLVDWKWKPGMGDSYWIVTQYLDVESLRWEDDASDSELLSLGNCFRIQKEAEAMAEKIKKLLKGGEK